MNTQDPGQLNRFQIGNYSGFRDDDGAWVIEREGNIVSVLGDIESGVLDLFLQREQFMVEMVDAGLEKILAQVESTSSRLLQEHVTANAANEQRLHATTEILKPIADLYAQHGEDLDQSTLERHGLASITPEEAKVAYEIVSIERKSVIQAKPAQKTERPHRQMANAL